MISVNIFVPYFVFISKIMT